MDPLDDLDGCCYQVRHPNALCHRLIALLLMCVLGFGSYFCYDNPGALQNEIKARQVNLFFFVGLFIANLRI